MESLHFIATISQPIMVTKELNVNHDVQFSLSLDEFFLIFVHHSIS